MIRQRRRRRTFLAVRIGRKNIWVSELLTGGMLGFLCAVFLGCLVILMHNENVAYRQHATIACMKAARIAAEKKLCILREKLAIAETVDSFTGGRMPPALLGELVELVYENSRAFGYDPMLVLAVIHVESVFMPDALGKYRSGKASGALGLMQLKFETACEVARELGMDLAGPEELLRPEVNILLGIAYLTRLIARFKSFKLGVVAYNIGPTAITQSVSTNSPFPLTFYARVLRSYYELKKTARIRQENLAHRPSPFYAAEKAVGCSR